MRSQQILEAFRCEAQRLAAATAQLTQPDWERATRCEPWRVRDLLAHVTIATGRLTAMLAAPAPAQAEVDAAGYYRPDARFAQATNTARVDLASEYAARFPDGRDLAGQFAATWQAAYEACRAEPADRVVRTRHGDAMLLPEFLLTRVVELAVHGLDLSDALKREPWLTEQASAVVTRLLLGRDAPAELASLGWDNAQFLRKATGRAPLDDPEAAHVQQLGIRWLTLG